MPIAPRVLVIGFDVHQWVAFCFKNVAQVVTPLSVVDLPESYKDALAGVTATFQASFQPISSRLEAFGKVF
jgi:hypothetical protein